MAMRRKHTSGATSSASPYPASVASAMGSVKEFAMNKSLGQHLLTNPQILDAIVKKAELRSTDTVLEIGPGTGNLTVRLLAKVKKVIAVEFDPRMVAELQKRVMGTPFQNKLEIIVGDAIKVDYPRFDVCVANTPYQISSALTFKLLCHRPSFRSAVLMFQREFAMRLLAKPNDELYCRLSVNCQLLSKVTHIIKVGKGNFRPPPKVDSSVVRLVPFDPPPPVDFEEWDGLVRLCFNRKNKTLGAIFRTASVLKLLEGNLKTFYAMEGKEMPADLPPIKEMVTNILESNEFISARSRKLELEDFLRLLACFNKEGLHFK
mmetsp:Transcript_30530/g.76615  ORF Transcript_30530/g.76615 Transcript_30530/m.76615 type:complete len:319 (-) Transcript_30530:46-1002(-)